LRTTIIIFGFALILSLSKLAASTEPGQLERLNRFNEAKFGMFIHWGPYSLASIEASWPIMRPSKKGISEADYRALPERFNPAKFDPQAWVRLAKAAGQRYMVFTTKHHDGFSMFDTLFSNYKITKTPYKKDILAELVAAAKAENMPLGFYYSPVDADHPAYRDTTKLTATNYGGEPARLEWPLYLEYMELQLRELLTRYGDAFVLWFDGGDNRKFAGARFHALIQTLQPATLINNRMGLVGDFVTPEQRLPTGIPVKGAKVPVGPGEKSVSTKVPKPEDFQPWETCMTINQTWAYNKNDKAFKSSRMIIRALIDAASKGGNLLLNVGPTPDGEIQPEFQERLLAVGAWLKVNGESIYGTTCGPLQELRFGRTTSKGKTIYLHVFDWPADGIELPDLPARISKVRLLAGNTTLKFTQSGSKVRIPSAGITPDADATVLAIHTK
jgi:alpha-L-fucosidase